MAAAPLINHWDVEELIVLPHVAPPMTILAPVGWLWNHPYLRPWAIWGWRLGWRGWVPSAAVGTCVSRYPDAVCPCGTYWLVWKECRHANEETDQDREESGRGVS